MAVVDTTDMFDDMQQYAVRFVTQSIEKNGENINEIAAAIKKEFDIVYGPTWHCVAGRNFGSRVSHEAKYLIFFHVKEVYVLIFKSG